MNTQRDLRDELVDYLPQIRRIVSKIVKYEDVVDDLSQEVCVRVIDKEGMYQKKGKKVTSWINAITKNLAINYMSKKRMPKQELTEDTIVSPELEKISEDQIKWVLYQFKSLTEKKQKILTMKYYQGMTATDIAKELQVSEATVSEHITEALKKMRKQARYQGLLSMLWPLNGDVNFVTKVFVMSKMKAVIVAVILCVMGCVGFVVYKSFVNDEALNKNSDIAITQANQVNTFSQKKKVNLQDLTRPVIQPVDKKSGVEKEDQQFNEENDIVVDKNENEIRIDIASVEEDSSLYGVGDTENVLFEWKKSSSNENHYELKIYVYDNSVGLITDSQEFKNKRIQKALLAMPSLTVDRRQEGESSMSSSGEQTQFHMTVKLPTGFEMGYCKVKSVRIKNEPPTTK